MGEQDVHALVAKRSATVLVYPSVSVLKAGAKQERFASRTDLCKAYQQATGAWLTYAGSVIM